MTCQCGSTDEGGMEEEVVDPETAGWGMLGGIYGLKQADVSCFGNEFCVAMRIRHWSII